MNKPASIIIEKKHINISRIDQVSKRTHGWFVRVRDWDTKKYHSKLFSDKKHGGKGSSLKVAIAWRDETQKKVNPYAGKNIHTKCRSNTGIIGVRYNLKKNRFEVSWVNSEGKQKHTSVSILQNGKKKAFEIACEMRKMREAERLNA